MYRIFVQYKYLLQRTFSNYIEIINQTEIFKKKIIISLDYSMAILYNEIRIGGIKSYSFQINTGDRAV